jgi:hypothetical protein
VSLPYTWGVQCVDSAIYDPLKIGILRLTYEYVSV